MSALAGLAGLGIGAYSAFRNSPGRQPTAFGGTSPGFRFGTQLDSEGRSVGSFLQRSGSQEQAEFANRFGRGLRDIDALRSEVRPGFGRFTDAAVRSIRNARRSALGDIRDQLARRRVLGSSFGQDAVARASAEFGLAEDKARAGALLNEIATSSQLLEKESQQIFAGVQRELAELQIAKGMAADFGRMIQAGTQFEQKLEANRIAGQAAFGGALAGQFLPSENSAASFGGGSPQSRINSIMIPGMNQRLARPTISGP
jgi:hypothetical protein